MSLLPELQEENKIVLSAEQGINLYLATNTSLALTPENWGVSKKQAEKFNSRTIESLKSKLQKATEMGESDEIQEAIEAIRVYQRKNLVFVGFTEATLEDNGHTKMVEAIVFYDPFTGGNLVMKQVIAVNSMKSINFQAGQHLLSAGEIKEHDDSENYIQGYLFDVTFDGNRENKGDSNKSSHHWVIQMATQDGQKV